MSTIQTRSKYENFKTRIGTNEACLKELPEGMFLVDFHATLLALWSRASKKSQRDAIEKPYPLKQGGDK